MKLKTSNKNIMKDEELKKIINKILFYKDKSIDFCPHCEQPTKYCSNPMYIHICKSCGKQCSEDELIHKSDLDFMMKVLKEEFQKEEHLKNELEKCKKSPYYFAINYIKVKSNDRDYEFHTNLTEDEFNEKFYEFHGVFKWSDDNVVDFVNWFLDLKKLSFRYKLENLTILESFKKEMTDFKFWQKKH